MNYAQCKDGLKLHQNFAIFDAALNKVFPALSSLLLTLSTFFKSDFIVM
jgi:hypothetical protein